MGEFFSQFYDFMTNLPDYLSAFATAQPVLVYLLLGAIVFCETGLVIMPFLPGDSLLFACGMLAKQGSLDAATVGVVFIVAALLGDNCNYWLGRKLGPKILRGERVPLLNRRNLDRTRAFFARHGGKSVMLARFVPIIRTFAPFTAGVGMMPYAKFMGFSFLGAVVWVVVCVGAGWFLGEIPFIAEHFELAMLCVIVASLIPIGIGIVRAVRENRQSRSEPGGKGVSVGRVDGAADGRSRDAA